MMFYNAEHRATGDFKDMSLGEGAKELFKQFSQLPEHEKEVAFANFPDNLPPSSFFLKLFAAEVENHTDEPLRNTTKWLCEIRRDTSSNIKRFMA
jgi:hypothetical protein